MAVTLTNVLKNMNEDLVQKISNITPSKTPIYSAIGKTSASQRYHETLTDTLNPPNADNARTEGADALVPSNTLVDRVGNYTQIFGKEVSVSNSVDASDVAGKGEFARQSANVMLEIKTDIEKSILSNNPSVGGTTRKSAGLEAIIKTNVIDNGGSASNGWNGTTYAAATDATTAVLTAETMVLQLAQKMYLSGAEIKDLYASVGQKAKLSAVLGGNSTRYNNAKDKQAFQNVDFYTTDVGEFAVKPHRMMRDATIIALDPEMIAWATLKNRSFKWSELGVTGDARKVQLVTEGTLEVRNEAGLGKIAGLKAS